MSLDLVVENCVAIHGKLGSDRILRAKDMLREQANRLAQKCYDEKGDSHEYFEVELMAIEAERLCKSHLYQYQIKKENLPVCKMVILQHQTLRHMLFLLLTKMSEEESEFDTDAISQQNEFITEFSLNEISYDKYLPNDIEVMIASSTVVGLLQIMQNELTKSTIIDQIRQISTTMMDANSAIISAISKIRRGKDEECIYGEIVHAMMVVNVVTQILNKVPMKCHPDSEEWEYDMESICLYQSKVKVHELRSLLIEMLSRHPRCNW
jgi:hypothetical protein